jgi:signal transduction histidine kinase
MDLLKPIRPEQGWRIGTKLMVFTIPPIVLMTLIAAWMMQQRTIAALEANLTKRAHSLTTQIMAEREYYASVIVPRVLDLGGSLGPDYREVHGRFPLPATFVREVSELTGSTSQGFRANVISPWPINPDKGLRDPFQREAFASLAGRPTGEFVRIDTMEGRRVLRVLSADRASAQSCVDCHNAHPQSPKHDFKLNDVMGGLEITIPMEEYLQDSRRNLTAMMAGGSLLCLMVLGVVALGTRRTISKPLALLAGLMQSDGPRSKKSKAEFAPHGDEVFHLTERFERLQEVIGQQQEQLREINAGLERRVLERTQALQSLEEQYRITMSSLPVSVLRLSADHVVQFANWTFYQTFSRQEADTLGKPIGAVFPCDCIDEVLRAMGPDGPAREKEVECQMPGGKRQIFRLTMRDIGPAPGGRSEQVMVIEDQTERKRMESQLRQADKLAALGTLLGGVAHELNNPLFIISGNVQLAIGKINRQRYEGLQDHLAAMYEASRRASAIIQRFLGAARSSGGRREPCQVNKLVEQTLELVANDLGIHQIEVRTDLPSTLPPVLADPQELTQVLLNLITNARQAMSGSHGRGILGVTTSLVAEQGKSWVEIRVNDDGPGIDRAELPRIFEPFYTTKPVGEGTGLGLAICHRIVTELGGNLTVDSVQGRGATFIIRLPVAAAEWWGATGMPMSEVSA